MRTFEVLTTVLVLLVASLLLIMPSRLGILRAACGILFVAVLVQVVVEGAHWQLIPLYAACFFVLVLGFFKPGLPRLFVVGSVVAGVLLVGMSVALSWLMPMSSLPEPTGSYAIGTRTIHLVDSSRIEQAGPSPSGKRELVIQVWYPAQRPPGFSGHLANYQRFKETTWRASYRSVLKTHSFQDAAFATGGPYPVILYNPAWQGERTEGTFQAENLASHGFVVVAIDHTFYGGLVAFPDGRVADSHNVPELGSFEHSTLQEESELGAKFTRIEAQDDLFVLDQMQAANDDPASPFFRHLDVDRVGAMGYSIGGAVAEQAAFLDSRIKAALNLDGWSFGELQQRGLAKPLMVIFEDKSNTLPTPDQLHTGPLSQQLFWQYSALDYQHVTDSLRAYGGWLLFIAGTNHVDFSDRSLFSPLRRWTGGGPTEPERTHAIVNSYTLAFFSHVLKQTREPLLESSTSPYREVDSQRFVAPLDANAQAGRSNQR